jgi:hypothetical protein
LLEATERFALKLKINLSKLALRRSTHGVRIAADRDALRGLHERLLPDRDDARIKLRRA